MNSYIRAIKMAGSRYAVFDMGRACLELTKKTFEEVTDGKKPYPRPFMNQALIIVVSDAGPDKPDRELFVFDPILLRLSDEGLAERAEIEGYMALMMGDMVQRMAMAGVAGSHMAGRRNSFSWKPTWGEAFMAQAYFSKKIGGQGMQERVDTAAKALKSNKVEAKVGANFSWSGDVGVPELGMAELIVLCAGNEVLAGALSHAVMRSSDKLLDSLCEFMTHAELPPQVLAAIRDRTKEVMARLPAGHSVYGQLIQSLASCKDYDAMFPIINGILDNKVGGNAEILTRVVRYHREFMGQCRAFDIDKVLEPASANPSGMDVLMSYLVDMMDVRNLQERMILLDFGRLSPGVKARLRVLLDRA